jgi:hypothetical protein
MDKTITASFEQHWSSFCLWLLVSLPSEPVFCKIFEGDILPALLRSNIAFIPTSHTLILDSLLHSLREYIFGWGAQKYLTQRYVT